MTCLEGFAISLAAPDGDDNEDSFALYLDSGIAAVADGIGGRPGGSQASQTAITAFVEGVLRADEATRCSAATLGAAASSANSAVRMLAASNILLTGAGTTLTAMVVDRCNETRAAIAHIGDSCAYRFRAGKLECLTHRHNVVSELVARGDLTEAQASRHALRGRLSRAIGSTDTVEPDIIAISLAPGDWFVLATDGVAGALSDVEMEDLLGAQGVADAESIGRRILAAAVSAKVRDDATVIVVRMPQKTE